MASSYTTLKAFSSFNDIDITNQIQQSMIMFFDWGFIDKGAYTNIRLGQQDINGNDQSLLRRVDEPNYTRGKVWETFHQNIVWESGMQTGQAINISGVYVNGSFKTPTTPGYEHYIDYPRGRVVFTTAQSTSASIKMEYSYKTILFDRISIFPEVNSIQSDNYDFTGFNSASSGNWSTLLRKQLPLVAVEASPLINYKPVDLGTGTNYVYTDILMHVIDVNDVTVNKLLSYISLQKEKTIYMPDIQLMATSGAFPLDYRGAKTSSPKTYRDLIDGNYRGLKLYFDDVTAQGSKLYGATIYHGVVRFKTETIALL